MRTRNTSYEDYDISQERVKDILSYCQSDGFDGHLLLMHSAVKANESIASEIYFSIVYNVSYDKFSKMKYIPISKEDFYGYRRKTIALFDRIME